MRCQAVKMCPSRPHGVPGSRRSSCLYGSLFLSLRVFIATIDVRLHKQASAESSFDNKANNRLKESQTDDQYSSKPLRRRAIKHADAFADRDDHESLPSILRRPVFSVQSPIFRPFSQLPLRGDVALPEFPFALGLDLVGFRHHRARFAPVLTRYSLIRRSGGPRPYRAYPTTTEVWGPSVLNTTASGPISASKTKFRKVNPQWLFQVVIFISPYYQCSG
ncbi:hypothetical protein CEP52_001528 [Fusarium oligoseptatum]|uniref:Uncharacterized protein n=1 Tax=Fusarium oligoseptatum TaxID=2604345 RepID=A0A428UI78_9HYPO|nr:hypothetical protein CEP52_001528 [Fusarium oligoseptatum]